MSTASELQESIEAKSNTILEHYAIGNGLSSHFSDSFLKEFQAYNDLSENSPVTMVKTICLGTS